VAPPPSLPQGCPAEILDGELVPPPPNVPLSLPSPTAACVSSPSTSARPASSLRPFLSSKNKVHLRSRCSYKRKYPTSVQGTCLILQILCMCITTLLDLTCIPDFQLWLLLVSRYSRFSRIHYDRFLIKRKLGYVQLYQTHAHGVVEPMEGC
jgi:hypothetical protein